jgi:hypothetical protein
MAPETAPYCGRIKPKGIYISLAPPVGRAFFKGGQKGLHRGIFSGGGGQGLTTLAGAESCVDTVARRLEKPAVFEPGFARRAGQAAKDAG